MSPLDDPRKLRDMILHKDLMERLDELGIYEDVADYIHENKELSIPEIQKGVSDKHGFTDLSTADINFIKANYYRPRVGNGRGARRKKVFKIR